MRSAIPTRWLLALALILAIPANSGEVFRIPEAWFKALAQVESGGRDAAVGRHGERTRFQILPRTARGVGKSVCGLNAAESRKVAETIWRPGIARYIRATKRHPTACDAYALWHRPGAFQKAGYRIDRLPRVVRERCSRFSALAKSFGPTSIHGAEMPAHRASGSWVCGVWLGRRCCHIAGEAVLRDPQRRPPRGVASFERRHAQPRRSVS